MGLVTKCPILGWNFFKRARYWKIYNGQAYSRHPGGSIKDPTETPQTSRCYPTEGYKGALN